MLTASVIAKSLIPGAPDLIFRPAESHLILLMLRQMFLRPEYQIKSMNKFGFPA